MTNMEKIKTATEKAEEAELKAFRDKEQKEFADELFGEKTTKNYNPGLPITKDYAKHEYGSVKPSFISRHGTVIEYCFWIAIGVVILLEGYAIGKAVGFERGFASAVETNRKMDCTFEFNNLPVSQVPARCWQYFTVLKGNI